MQKQFLQKYLDELMDPVNFKADICQKQSNVKECARRQCK